MIKNFFKKLANTFYTTTGIPTNTKQRIDKDCKKIATNITSCLPDFRNGGVKVTVNPETHDLNITVNKDDVMPLDIKTIETTTFSFNEEDLNSRYEKIIVIQDTSTRQPSALPK